MRSNSQKSVKSSKSAGKSENNEVELQKVEPQPANANPKAGINDSDGESDHENPGLQGYLKSDDEPQNQRADIIIQNQSSLAPKNDEKLDQPYLSDNMAKLKNLLERYKVSQAGQTDQLQLNQEIWDLSDSLMSLNEILMMMYLCVSRFNNERTFNSLAVKNKFFKDFHHDWYLLFSEKNIFTRFQRFQTSSERCQFNQIVLKAALEKEYTFMIEEVLDGRAPITNRMIEDLLRENQRKLLIHLIAIPKAMEDTLQTPKYINLDERKYSRNIRKTMKNILGSGASPMQLNNDQDKLEHIFKGEEELHFNDILEVALHIGEKSDSIKELMMLIRQEVVQKRWKVEGDERKREKMMNQFDTKYLFRTFVKLRKIKLLRYLFNQRSEFEFSTGLFHAVLEEDAFDIACMLHQEFKYVLRENTFLENKQIVSLLVQSLNKQNEGAGMIEQKAFLLREYMDYFSLRQARQMLDYIEKMTAIPNKTNLFVTNFNVVKTGCILIELMQLVSIKFEQLSVRTKAIREKIEATVFQYMEQVSGEAEMRYLLLEKDFQDRDALDFITEYKIVQFLLNAYSQHVVNEIWRSSYATSDLIFSASTNFFLLFQFYHCTTDEEKKHRFYNKKDISKIHNHSMQFTVWRYSGKSRMMTEFVAIAIIASITHILLRDVLNYDDAIVKRVNAILDIQAKYMTSEDKLEKDQLKKDIIQYQADSQQEFELFFNRMMGLVWMSFVCISFVYNYLAEIAFTAVTKRIYTQYESKLILDFSIFFTFFSYICITFARNLGETISEGPGIVEWQEKAQVYCINYVKNKVNEHRLLIIGVVLLWIKVISYAKYNEYLGRFLGIVKRMLSEVFLIFVFWLINLSVFSILAEASFPDLSEYAKATEAFRTLFFACFGTFDFERIAETRLGEKYGYAFLLIFLIINMFLFMNLFIAAITVLFSVYEKNSNVYQMIETLKVRSTTQADKNFSILISMLPPFNIFLLILGPFVVSAQEPAKWNKACLMLAYLPVLLLVTLIYAIAELIFWPFVYVKMVFHKLTMVWVYSKSFRVSRADKFAEFIQFVFFGILIIPGNSLIDIYYYMKHMLQGELQKMKHKTQHDQISKDNMKVFKKIFEDKQEKILYFPDISHKLRADMNIMNQVRGCLFPDFDQYQKSKFEHVPADSHHEKGLVDELGLLATETDKQKQKSEKRMQKLKDINNYTRRDKRILLSYDDLNIEEVMVYRRKDMINQIKQFALMKQILDRNCQLLGIETSSVRDQGQLAALGQTFKNESHIQKFKTIDCQFFYHSFQELKRQKIVAQMKDEDFIFIQKPSAAQNKEAMRQTVLDGRKADKKGEQPQSNRLEDAVGYNTEKTEMLHLQEERKAEEETRQIEKRGRNLYKKFFYMNNNRMLKILGYTPSQSDEKKFLHSNQKMQIEKIMVGDVDLDDGAAVHSQLKPQHQISLASDNLPPQDLPRQYEDQQFVDNMSNRVTSMDSGSLLRLQNTAALLRNEVQNMLTNYKPILQRMPSEAGFSDQYQEFSKKLSPEDYQFLATYKDAMNCVEQIAERQQSFDHYQQTTGCLVGALQNNEVNLTSGGLAAGENVAQFGFKQAHANAKDVFAKYKLAQAGTRDEFLKNLQTAIDDHQ